MERINGKLCKKCGGRCCKKLPGGAWPEDLMIDNECFEDVLFKLFVSGNWVIDWWEGDPREGKYDMDRGYFVRPAIVNCERVFDPSYGGKCCFLSADGCLLSFEKRPRECRDLIPNENGKCFFDGIYGKKSAAIAWIPFYNMLLRCGEKAEIELIERNNINGFL